MNLVCNRRESSVKYKIMLEIFLHLHTEDNYMKHSLSSERNGGIDLVNMTKTSPP